MASVPCTRVQAVLFMSTGTQRLHGHEYYSCAIEDMYLKTCIICILGHTHMAVNMGPAAMSVQALHPDT